MDIAEREYAAQQLLAFLGLVGPLEAIWAMNTALKELQELPASENHVAAAARAFADAQAEARELAAVPAAETPAEAEVVEQLGQFQAPAAEEPSDDKAPRGKKAPAPQ